MTEQSWRKPWRALSVITLVLLAAAASFAQTGDDASRQRMKKDIFYLASEECEGRGIDTQGINKAADYIVSELKAAGVKPGGKDGSYFQPFTVQDGTAKIEGTNTLTLRGPVGQEIHLTMGKDFEVLPSSVSGKVTSPVVFAGYGLQVK